MIPRPLWFVLAVANTGVAVIYWLAAVDAIPKPGGGFGMVIAAGSAAILSWDRWASR